MRPEPPSYSCEEGGPRGPQRQDRGRAAWVGLGGHHQRVPTVLVMVVASWVSSCGTVQGITDFKCAQLVGYQLSFNRRVREIGHLPE